MSTSPAGSSKKTFGSRKDYLAPLPLPTGQKPGDCLNIIWRKNDIFLDISNFCISSASALAWFQTVFCLALAILLSYITSSIAWEIFLFGAVMTCLSVVFLIIGLKRPTPLPMRFNRQRREACFLHKNGEYRIVPWESVVATTTEFSTVTQGGRISHGMLLISLENPDPDTANSDLDFAMVFPCGGGTPAMALWECVRTYMEVGPDAVSDLTARFAQTKGIWASYVDNLLDSAKRKGWFMALLWEGFFGLFIFNVLLADLLERKKLYPLPDLNHPDIIEWSKPLPREQWASPSPELQAALAKMGVKPEVRV